MEAVEVYGTSMNRIKRNENTGCLCHSSVPSRPRAKMAA